jgi:hypothetical protein
MYFSLFIYVENCFCEGQSPSGRSETKIFGYDELQLEVKFNSNLIIKKIIGKIA